jgi:hypothetical protein
MHTQAPLTSFFPSGSGPNEVLLRRRPNYEPLRDRLIPGFAAAWLAFDGFSPDAVRGAHTPNLSRAREKWRVLAPVIEPDPSAAESRPPTASGAEAALAEAGADDVVNVSPDDWVPIVPQSPSSTGTPQPTESDVDIHTTTDNFTPITTAATTTVADPSATLSPPPIPSSLEPASTENPVGSKMSRRDRILHLARQNAQTPLPEQPQPVAEVEAEKVKEESEQEGKERTIRERLWRLVGGNY